MPVTVMQVFALLFLVCGVFELGVFVGEYRMIQRDKRSKILHSKGTDDYLFLTGTLAVVIAIVLAVIAANPFEKLQRHADEIRSSAVTAETNR